MTTIATKAFICYRNGDSSLRNFSNQLCTTARDYVEALALRFDVTNLYKRETNDEELSTSSESTIDERLKDNLYDSTITIVLLSPQMRDNTKAEKEQWIPWEISYSLRKLNRGKETNQRNAMLAVILPDVYGKYDWFASYRENELFSILKQNIDTGYIPVVSWDDFQKNPQDQKTWVDKAVAAQKNTDEALIHVQI